MKHLTSPPSSSYTLTPTFDTKRQSRFKDEFHYKYGQRLHSYDNEKAPYPLSYDRHVLEMYVVPLVVLEEANWSFKNRESLDNRLCQHLRGSASFVNFKGDPPERILDLGCGVGSFGDFLALWPWLKNDILYADP